MRQSEQSDSRQSGSEKSDNRQSGSEKSDSASLIRNKNPPLCGTDDCMQNDSQTKRHYLQPEQVAQCPEHFFAGLPVAENISPAHSRSACSPQAGQRTASSNFLTSSSNFLPHLGQTYCNTGILSPAPNPDGRCGDDARGRA